MNNNVNNRAVNQTIVINDSDFLMFREFAKNNEENMRVQPRWKKNSVRLSNLLPR